MFTSRDNFDAQFSSPGVDEAALAKLLAFAIEGASPAIVLDHRQENLQTHIDGYEMLERLGEGGMGAVWRARQLGTGRDVALKILGPRISCSARARLRFEREVELGSRLEHVGIARIYESGMHQGAAYFSMELIDGLPIDQYVQRRQLNAKDILRLMILVCDAIQYAHQRGVIHRDLKPANILVTADGQPHVVDFGLARPLSGDEDSGLTREGETAGTLAFMSAEQAAGHCECADTRSDVYGLGATLYWLLTGHLPHDLRGPRHVVMQRIVHDDPRRPRKFNREIDAELESVLLKALSRRPEDRYASVGELASDIRRYLNGQPIAARPITSLYVARKWVGRHWMGAASMAAVLAILVACASYAYAINLSRRRAAVADARRDAQLRQLAEQRLAESLIAQGDAMANAGRWAAAKALYNRAWDSLEQMHLSPRMAELGLVNVDRIAPPPLNEFSGTFGAVTACAFAHDQRRAVSGSSNGQIKLWDLRTGQCLNTFNGHEREIACLTFSPDDRLLLSGSKDHTARLWDLAVGKEIHCFPQRDEVKWLTFSPDGFRCVCSCGLSAKVYLTRTGTEVSEFDGGGCGITCVAFSPDGHYCLSGLSAFGMWSWDPATGKGLTHIPVEQCVNSIAFSPDGSLALTGSQLLWDRDRPILLRLWNTRTWEPVRSFSGHTSDIGQVGFSGDGKSILSFSNEGTVKAWDVRGGSANRTLTSDAESLEHVAFSDDGRRVLSGGADGVMRLWEVGPDLGVSTFGHSDQIILRAALSSDGRIALTAYGNGSIVATDVATGMELYHIASGSLVVALAISPDGTYGMFVSSGGQVWVFENVPGGRQWKIADHHNAQGAAFSGDGKLIMSVSGDQIRLFDAGSYRQIAVLKPPATLIRSAAFSRDSKRILACTSHGDAVQWEWIADAPIALPSKQLRQRDITISTDIGYSSDGSRIFANCDSMLVLWEAATGRELCRFPGRNGRIMSVVVEPSDHWAASGGTDGAVEIWDLDHLQQAGAFVGHRQHVSTLSFSADGNFLLSGSYDKSAIVWDMQRPAEYRRMSRDVLIARKRLRANPDDLGALIVLGEWYAFRGHWDWAAEMLDRAGSREGIPSLLMARCYWRIGRMREAEAEFSKALRNARGGDARYLQLCLQSIRATDALNPASGIATRARRTD